MDIKELLENITDYVDKEITLSGWVKNNRNQKAFGFIDFFDGTSFNSIQVVYDDQLKNFEEISKFRVGSALKIKGKIVKAPKKEAYEIKATDVELLADCPENYPIQPKRHSREFLREVAHLRPRTNLFRAVFRIRSVAAHAIHTYFQEKGFIYLHAPIITASDCEGAGEMFKVTTLHDINKNTDYKEDFFGKETGLTVSGQLQGEAFAHAFKKIYTFGPTFRAENSNTKTHASEFWMIEPEVCFMDLNGTMDLEEDMLKFIIKYVMDKCSDEIEFLNKFVEEGLINKLNSVLNSKAARITHKEAVEILLNSNKKFEFKVEHGQDLATEHEKYLTEEHFNSPVFVYNWPKDIKAFYMRMNDDDTVAAVDLLVPGSGELMGGSQREERIDILINRMKDFDIKPEDMDWYLDLRKYGGTIHSGFGLGFERLIIYLTGVENIRDVIPFPRTPNNCKF